MSGPAPAATVAPPPAPAPRRRGRRAPSYAYVAPPATRRAQRRLGIVFVLPLVAMVAVFLLLPMASAVYYVFVDFNGINPQPPFVGLANITEVFGDPEVYDALWNNVIWIVIGTLAPLLLGLGLALLLTQVRRGSVFYRTVFFVPFVLPQVAVGVVWGWIYAPSRGWLNNVLEAVGLDAFTTGWLGNPDTALYAVLATAVWSQVGFVFVIFLSALRNVDVDLVDAARLDGANGAQRLRHVVLPQIMPVLLMVFTITLLGGFSVFDIIFVMTGGGPAGATEVLGTYAYSSAFQLNRISYGTTLALLITVMAIPFAVWLNRLQRRTSLEGGAT
ncbi:sugar ABC transporter permease [Nocardioides sp. S-58]|uniref:Sugar ABC transporter permease n=1 Tax=Nocardioides renjunii TaxID=3095075 RepID=A0ABU5KI37_9ACTN|nr:MULTISPECIES: sugar ABC transporter permease [unclassified Nocardioides]MDZ5664150.1 sugar ABC transporter permease [Nocardioides sp. S-58]WQQ22628.1 sugar ABC transporter permease [Nocardioides sp. S-34]